MKKIFIFLVFISSLFADACVVNNTDEQFSSASSASSCYISYNGSNYVRSGISYAGQTETTNVVLPESYLSPDVTFVSSTSVYMMYYYRVNWFSGGQMIYKHVYYQINYRLSIPSDCPSPNQIINGSCSAPSIPTCPTGSHNNTEIAGSPCFSDFEQDSLNVFDNGNQLVMWADNATTWCEASTGQCLTHDVNGNRIANRFINPFLYADGSTGEGVFRGVVPTEFPSSKTIADFALDNIGNATGKTLQALGMGIMITGSGNGVLMYDGFAGMNLLNPSMSIGGAIFTLGNALVTPDNVIATTPDTTGNVNVNVIQSTADASVSSMENATPTDGSPAFSPNGFYTYKQVTDANLKTIWDTAAGVGKLPPNSLVLGSDIIYPTNNPDKAIIQTPDKILFVETKPDNSATVLEVSKNDLANYANNNTDLNYIKTQVAPPTINNDGTVSQTSSTSVGTASASTNTNTTTSQTGTTSVSNPITGTSPLVNTTSSTGETGTADLSGVTSRLDKISNQLTKQNEFQDELKKETGSVSHPFGNVDAPVNYYDLTSTDETLSNLKKSAEDIILQGETIKALFQNGFTPTLLAGGTVQTCVYSSSIDLLGNAIPVSFDLCKAFSPMRPLFYSMFYLFFLISMISFSIKSIFRLAV